MLPTSPVLGVGVWTTDKTLGESRGSESVVVKERSKRDRKSYLKVVKLYYSWSAICMILNTFSGAPKVLS